jgi:hypothetical protein
VIVVLFLLQFILGGIVQAIFSSINDSFIGYSLGDLIVRVLIAPLSAIAASVMYFELRRLHGEPLLEGAAPSVGTPDTERVSSPAPTTTPAPGAGEQPPPAPSTGEQPPPAGSPGAPPPPGGS